jgi:23S rRNA (uracil1939-C5)-methyltransferase
MRLSPAEQRIEKTASIHRAFARFTELRGLAIEEMSEPKPLIGYRTRAKLMVGGRTHDRGPRLGLYREGTHDVIDIPSCIVLTRVLEETAAALRTLLAEPPVETGFVLVPSEDGGALEAFDLREVRDEQARVMLTLVLSHARTPHEPMLAAAVSAIRKVCPHVASIAINWRGRGPQVLGPETFVAWGPSELPDRIDDESPFAIATHGSFVQAHRGTAAAMHDEIVRALHELTPHEERLRVIELFAGSGALALRLSASGILVHAVEVFAPSIELARRAAQAQQITGLSIQAADAGAAMARLSSTARFDAAIVDPPRRGLTPEVRTGIAHLAPSRVIYVSCDPETLARDLAHFARLGYSARRVLPFDLMPLTAHVETLVVLERARPAFPRILYEDELMILVDKDPHEPVESMPSRAVSTLSRLRMVPGAEDAVVVLSLDADASGIVVFARHPTGVHSIEDALARGTITDIALVRGITHRKGTLGRDARARGRASESKTTFTRRAVWGGHSLVSFSPNLAHPQRPRRDFASMRHDVLGDSQYGHMPSNRHLWERAALDRPFLHRERLEWVSPHTVSPRVLEAPLPPDLVLVRDRITSRNSS